MKRIKLPYMNPEQVANEIGDFVADTVRGIGATGCTIGLSGGVDSTTTAALIDRAFAGTNLELVGYVLPSSTNHSSDSEDGIFVAEALDIRYETHSIEGIVEAYAGPTPEALEDDFHRGNLTSRIRGNVLNTKSAVERKVLAGTGNRDEDYGIGYFTLFGDGAVHMNPIGGLSKRLVREMAAYLGFENLAHREPTAGLEPGQTDFKDLGYKYDLVELVIEGTDQGLAPEDLARHEQIVPVFEQQQQLYAQEYGAPKFSSAQGMVDDILRRHEIAKAKGEIVSGPVPHVTLEYR